MSQYENFLDGLSNSSTFTKGEDCVGRRTEFYKCVIEKKNELTKSISDWTTYRNQVRGFSQECFESNSLADCSNYFSIAEINY